MNIYPEMPWVCLSLQLLLMERKLQEVHPLLTLCGQIVENWQGNPIQKESLRVFFLVLQVTHYLDAGQVQPGPVGLGHSQKSALRGLGGDSLIVEVNSCWF